MWEMQRFVKKKKKKKKTTKNWFIFPSRLIYVFRKLLLRIFSVPGTVPHPELLVYVRYMKVKS